MKERDFLLLDGDCGLCHRLATFMDKRLARGQDIGYRPILSDEGQAMIAEMPKKQQDADSVYLIRNGKSYIRSAAQASWGGKLPEHGIHPSEKLLILSRIPSPLKIPEFESLRQCASWMRGLALVRIVSI